jgi:hypothetical protein
MESSTELEDGVDEVVNTADVEISGVLTSARKAGFWKRTSRDRIRRS